MECAGIIAGKFPIKIIEIRRTESELQKILTPTGAAFLQQFTVADIVAGRADHVVNPMDPAALGNLVCLSLIHI